MPPKTEVARGYVVVALPCMTLFDLACRYWLRRRLHRLRAQGACMRKVVVVGHEDVISELTAVLRRETYHGLSIVAACVVGPDHPAVIDGIPVVGGLQDVTDVVRRFQADTVAVLACREMMGCPAAQPRLGPGEVRHRHLRGASPARRGRPADDDQADRGLAAAARGSPGIHRHQAARQGGLRQRVRVHRAGASSCRYSRAIALAITLGDRGPVLFRQTRVGKDGTPFTLFKFRTMVVDAEQRKAELMGLNDSDGVLFKMRKDPRITRVGSWLRRYSLDELPQLFNVLNGDMSLVGPRPALPDETTQYGDYVRRRLVVKPGITGLWQVNGRSNLPWDEAVRLDVRYVENWSFFLDLQILWKTWSAVAHADGAY